jgi:hypothetical protein
VNAENGLRWESELRLERRFVRTGLGRTEEDPEHGKRGRLVAERGSPLVDAGDPGAVVELEEEEGSGTEDLAGEDVARQPCGVARQEEAPGEGVAEVVWRGHACVPDSRGRRPR